MGVLGMRLTVTGDPESAVSHRMRKGWQSFFAIRPVLRQWASPLQRRLDLFHKKHGANPSMGAGGHTVSIFREYAPRSGTGEHGVDYGTLAQVWSGWISSNASVGPCGRVFPDSSPGWWHTTKVHAGHVARLEGIPRFVGSGLGQSCGKNIVLGT